MATTKIDGAKTAGEITQLLSKYGANQILTQFDNGEITGLSFIIIKNKKDLPFRLPIRWEPVLDAMAADNRTPQYLCNPEQARRVAWRQIKRWIEAQLALLSTGMVQMEEVFMPYLLVDNQEKTLYEKLSTSKFKQIELK